MPDAPNIPARSRAADVLPESLRRVEAPTMTQQDMNALDPNIPRVALRIPTDLYPEMIRAPDAAAPAQQPGGMPPLYNMQDFGAQAANIAEQPTIAQTAASGQQRQFEQVPPPLAGTVPGSQRVPGQPLMHPVLESLMRDFQLTEQDGHDFEYRGHTYKLMPLTAELMGFCTSLASRTSQSNDEYMYRLALIMGVISVIAIDGIPCSVLFSAQVSALKISYNPFNPPYAVRVKFAPSLLEMFTSTLKIHVAARIAEEYDNAFDESSDIVAAAEKIKATAPVDKVDERVHFRCNVDGCGFIENVIPDYIDVSSGSIRPRYCPTHGPTMTPVGYTREITNAPLA
jgi:hypothetical protein